MAKTRLDDASHLAAIVNSSDVAIYAENVDGILTFWNHAAEGMFGYTASEALGQSIYFIIPDDRREEEADVQRRIHQGERVPHYETIRRTKRGTLIDVSVVASPITTPNGAIVGVSKVARDITAQRRLKRSCRSRAPSSISRTKRSLPGISSAASSNGTREASGSTAIRAAKPSAGSATNSWRRSIPGRSMRFWSGCEPPQMVW